MEINKNVMSYGAETRTYSKAHASCQTSHCIETCFTTVCVCHHFFNKCCMKEKCIFDNAKDDSILNIILLAYFLPMLCADCESKLTSSSQNKIE